MQKDEICIYILLLGRYASNFTHLLPYSLTRVKKCHHSIDILVEIESTNTVMKIKQHNTSTDDFYTFANQFSCHF